MPKVLGIYILIEVGVLCLAAVSLMFWDKRYRKNHGPNIPAGFQRTNEATVDPKTGKQSRVYYNSNTGERFYHEENN